MKTDYDKYKNIEIDKDKFKDITTNVEQLRNCLAICYILMEDKDKEIERLNNIINGLEKYIEENKHLASGVKELKGYAYMFYYNKTDELLDKLKELKENTNENNSISK